MRHLEFQTGKLFSVFLCFNETKTWEKIIGENVCTVLKIYSNKFITTLPLTMNK